MEKSKEDVERELEELKNRIENEEREARSKIFEKQEKRQILWVLAFVVLFFLMAATGAVGIVAWLLIAVFVYLASLATKHDEKTRSREHRELDEKHRRLRNG